MRYTHIIWDFNGTLLDDVVVGIECVNLMLSARHLKTVDDVDEYRRLFRFPIIDYYRLAGFDFEKDDYYTVLAPEWIRLYSERMACCTWCPEAVETIAAVREHGLSQSILSATKQEQLLLQLAMLHAPDGFEEIMGLDNIHAHSKSELAVLWKERHSQAVPLFVGDTEHDAQTARAIGADCLLYTGGHQDEGRLSACGFPLIRRLSDVLSFL